MYCIGTLFSDSLQTTWKDSLIVDPWQSEQILNATKILQADRSNPYWEIIFKDFRTNREIAHSYLLIRLDHRNFFISLFWVRSKETRSQDASKPFQKTLISSCSADLVIKNVKSSKVK